MRNLKRLFEEKKYPRLEVRCWVIMDCLDSVTYRWLNEIEDLVNIVREIYIYIYIYIYTYIHIERERERDNVILNFKKIIE